MDVITRERTETLALLILLIRVLILLVSQASLVETWSHGENYL